MSNYRKRVAKIYVIYKRTAGDIVLITFHLNFCSVQVLLAVKFPVMNLAVSVQCQSGYSTSILIQ
jgi:hypothetical protein